VLATGATDRIMPLPGWTRPGCYSLGASQIALKAQGCSIGEKVVFAGSGPLLYLVAWQYMKSGNAPAMVLDAGTFAAQLRALPLLAARPGTLLKGMKLLSDLKRAGVPIRRGIRPLEVTGNADGVTGLRYAGSSGKEHSVACNAVGMGYHLRAESQLADLAGCAFAFHPPIRQWLPEIDDMGRSSVANVYLAGDGVRILGADGAEVSGQLAALALLSDRGDRRFSRNIAPLLRERARNVRFAKGIAAAFPWPHAFAADIPDETLVCRCEAITAGELRAAAASTGAAEVNRAKAFSRVGMGRCQGRFCGIASQEIVAAARKAPIESSGRLRGQAPVKPLPVALVKGESHG
jgi:bacterioferritin-associated ferredoxin